MLRFTARRGPGSSPVDDAYRGEHMRDATGITVHRAIMHIVDHRTGSEPVLSELELPLDAHQKLQEW